MSALHPTSLQTAFAGVHHEYKTPVREEAHGVPAGGALQQRAVGTDAVDPMDK
jgi:hypothetical protein